MKALKRLVYLILLIPITGYSQCPGVPEVCDNGIDDDCDGLIDCFDPDCGSDIACDSFYYGQPLPECMETPVVEYYFDLVEEWSSARDIATRQTPVVGDLDGDGFPEVVSFRGNDPFVGLSQGFIFDGRDGSLKYTMDVETDEYTHSGGIADVDGDGLGEIYVVDVDHYLRCFNFDGTPRVGFVPPIIRANGAGAAPSSYSYPHPAFADFNGDGNVEVYLGNQIYNASTGALVAQGDGLRPNGSFGGAGGPSGQHRFPVAYDVLPDAYCADCAGLELICGNAVYSVNVATGSMTIASKFNDPGWANEGTCAIADWNRDGQIDILNSHSHGGGAVTIWDPRTMMRVTTDGSGNPLVGNPSITGRGTLPCIEDLDDDGLLEYVMVGLNNIYMMDNDLTLVWSRPVVEASSGTMATAFDFEGDGIMEIVYRDEQNLFVIDARDGEIRAQAPCRAATRVEMPVIADVDNDGEAEIICHCGPPGNDLIGKVKVFRSEVNKWMPTRKIWNTANYYPSSINQDLTIPRQFQNKAIVPGQDVYLAQANITSFDDVIIHEAIPDFVVSVDTITKTDCDSDTTSVELRLCNHDFRKNEFGYDLSYYDGDPLIGGTLLGTERITELNTSYLSLGCVTITLTVPAGNYDLYVYVNDDGSNPMGAPTHMIEECDSTNNLAIANIRPCVFENNLYNVQICAGDSAIITSTKITPVWDGMEPFIEIAPNRIQISPSVNTVYTASEGGFIDSFIVTVNELPVVDLGETQNICALDSIILDASNGDTSILSYLWNTGEISSEIYVNTAGVYVVELTDTNFCVGRDSMEVLIKTSPSIDSLGPKVICNGDSTGVINLMSTPPGSNFTWTSTAVDLVGTLSDEIVGATGLPNHTPSYTGTDTQGSVTYTITPDLDGCIGNSTEFVVFVDAKPVASVGADQYICSNNTILTGNDPSPFTGLWTNVDRDGAGIGPGVITNNYEFNSTLTGLVNSDSTYLEWTVSNGVCPDSVALLKIKINDDELPSVILSASPTSICTGSPVDLIAIGSGGGTDPTFEFYIVGDIIRAADVNNTYLNSVDFINMSTSTDTVLAIVEMTSESSCLALGAINTVRDTVAIIVDPAPSPSVPGDDQILCSDTTNMAATLPAIGYGTWTYISGPGSIAATELNDRNATVSGLSASAPTVYAWVVRSENNLCPSDSNIVSISSLGIRTIPEIRLNGGAFTNTNVTDSAVILCLGEDYILTSNSADVASGETGIWIPYTETHYSISPGGSAINQDLNLLSPTAYPFWYSGETLAWVINSPLPGCGSDTAKVDISIVDTLFTHMNVSEDTLCFGDYLWISWIGNNITRFDISEPFDYDISYAIGNGASFSNVRSSNSPIRFTAVGDNGACPVVEHDTLVYFFDNERPQIDLITDDPICIGEDIKVNANITPWINATHAGGEVSWNYQVNGGPEETPDESSDSTALVLGDKTVVGTYTVNYFIDYDFVCMDVDADTTKSITVNVVDKPNPAIRPGDTVICETELPLSYYAYNTLAGSILTWFFNGSAIGSNPSMIIDDLAGSGQYFVVEDNGVCDPDTSNTVLVQIELQPDINITFDPNKSNDNGDAIMSIDEILNLQATGSINGVWSIIKDPSDFQAFFQLNNNPNTAFDPNGYDGEYIIQYVGYNDSTVMNCVDSAWLDIYVLSPIRTPDAFTPNGDGVNDYFTITGLKGYSGARIEIFNRWGNILYSIYGGENYNVNPWDGKFRGKDLPVGVYYYTIDFGIAADASELIEFTAPISGSFMLID